MPAPPARRAATVRSTRFRAARTAHFVLVGGADGEAEVFELATGRRLTRLPLGAPLRDAVFSPDGKSVVTGDAEGVIIRWDTRSGEQLARAVHGAPIRELAVSPDGRRVASAAGQAAQVWLAVDGSRVARLPHPLAVDGVSFDSTGTQPLTIARDARISTRAIGAGAAGIRPAGPDRHGSLLSERALVRLAAETTWP